MGKKARIEFTVCPFWFELQETFTVTSKAISEWTVAYTIVSSFLSFTDVNTNYKITFFFSFVLLQI
jgi:hypothetical protein